MVRMIPSLATALLLAMPVAAAAEPPQPATAAQLYLKHCKNCHGSDGKAETKMGKKHEIDSFVDTAWQQEHGDAEIRKAITDGVPKTKMKAYGKKLDAAQISALVGHVRGFAPGVAAAPPAGATPVKVEQTAPIPAKAPAPK